MRSWNVAGESNNSGWAEKQSCTMIIYNDCIRSELIVNFLVV